MNAPAQIYIDSAKGYLTTAPLEMQKSFVGSNTLGGGYRDAANMHSEGQGWMNQWGSDLYSGSEVQDFGYGGGAGLVLPDAFFRDFYSEVRTRQNGKTTNC